MQSTSVGSRAVENPFVCHNEGFIQESAMPDGEGRIHLKIFFEYFFTSCEYLFHIILRANNCTFLSSQTSIKVIKYLLHVFYKGT